VTDKTNRGEESSNGDGRGDRNANPFDPARLRITQGFGDAAHVRRLVASCPVRKPDRQEFVRVHAAPEMSIEVALLEFKQERQHYLVDPALAPSLPGEAVPKLLVTAISQHGGLMLWPIKLPDEKSRLDPWNEVALMAAERAKTSWIRLASNMPKGTYDVWEAQGEFPEPEWPDVTLDKLLELAFQDRFIQDADHPVLRRLRGEV
jgi:hypothetical protein